MLVTTCLDVHPRRCLTGMSKAACHWRGGRATPARPAVAITIMQFIHPDTRQGRERGPPVILGFSFPSQRHWDGEVEPTRLPNVFVVRKCYVRQSETIKIVFLVYLQRRIDLHNLLLISWYYAIFAIYYRFFLNSQPSILNMNKYSAILIGSYYTSLMFPHRM